MADIPRKDQAFKYLVNYGLTTRDVLNNPNSPQAKALDWIANNDAFKMDIPNFSGENGGTPNGLYSDTRFAERWALAVFYYSTGGDEWTYKLNFLEPIDHCDWYFRFVTQTGDIIRQGVTECKMFPPKFNEERVSRIEICKLFVDFI